MNRGEGSYEKGLRVGEIHIIIIKESKYIPKMKTWGFQTDLCWLRYEDNIPC